jgi:hypothetical protein
MWRFILISFGFLGFAFYELSGGADYAPAEGSLQVVMRDTPIFAPAPAPQRETQMAEGEVPNIPEEAPAAADPAEDTPPADPVPVRSAGIDSDAHDGFEISLASLDRPLNGGSAMAQRPIARIGTFSAETLVQDVGRLPIQQALVTQQQPADIRQVKGSRANMRSGPGTDFAAVDQLSLGTQVEVLDRRGAWVELRDLETGRLGWMADWLVSAAN